MMRFPVDKNGNFYEEVGRRIRAARLRRRPKLTQQGLADLVSLTRTSITNVEKGRQKLLVHTLCDIAAAVNVDPASLLPKQPSEPAVRLDAVLKGRPRSEKEWIRSAVSAVQQEVSNGS